MQKYRADVATTQLDGSIVWSSNWIGGPSLAKIDYCQLATLAGEPRATVYITAEADTYFSQPAVCRYMGKRVKGYVTGDDNGNIVFRHGYYT